MAQTREGGLKSAAKLKNIDPEYYVKIGRKGGKAKVPKGFSMNQELASKMGKLGGKKSRKSATKEALDPEA